MPNCQSTRRTVFELCIAGNVANDEVMVFMRVQKEAAAAIEVMSCGRRTHPRRQ